MADQATPTTPPVSPSGGTQPTGTWPAPGHKGGHPHGGPHGPGHPGQPGTPVPPVTEPVPTPATPPVATSSGS